MTYINDALVAYAAGDAFGVFHEFNPDAPRPVPNQLLAKAGWPFGGISDDTLLTLLTITSLQESTPAGAAKRFLKELHRAAPSLRGLGPTTRHALGLAVKESEQHLIGRSNGAIMRTALLGLAFDHSDRVRRDEWISALVRCTHSDPTALSCAIEMAAIFSEAGAHGNKAAIPQPDEKWEVSAEGVSLDPRDTFNAVLSVVHRSHTTADAYLFACELGGDTDTVAALSGALVTLIKRDQSGLRDIPWLGDVDWSEIPTLDSSAKVLENFRKPTTWIIGPLAWDTVTYLDQEVPQGGFTQSLRTIERPGGTGANVAIGLASTGHKVGFVGYVGDDEFGKKLIAHLESSEIAQLAISRLVGESNHVLIMITPNGERSMIGVTADRLSQATIDTSIFRSDDTVVFVQWREEFGEYFRAIRERVRRTIVGIEALSSTSLTGADIAIGSHHDLKAVTLEEENSELRELLSKFPTIVVTYGEAGAKEYVMHASEIVVRHQHAFPVDEIKDATGAGDSFLAGYLRGLADPAVCDSSGAQLSPMEIGARWAALAVATEQSFPPNWALLGISHF